MKTNASGLKITLPSNPLGCCAYCQQPRGTKTRGWERIVDRSGTHRGWSCPECPRYGEPIRKVVTSKGRVRWRFTVTVLAPGASKAVQQAGTADTLEEAREQVAKIRAEIRTHGTYSKPTHLTVRTLADRWLAAKEKDVLAGNLRRVTLQSSYASALTSVCHLIGQKEAETLTPADVRDLLATMKTKGSVKGKPLGKASLTKALLTLRLIFAWGIEQRWLTANPAASVKVPKFAATADDNDERGDATWSVEHYGTFLDYVDTEFASGTAKASADPWVRAGLRLTACGLRRSEVLGLDWTSVDLIEGTVAVVASRVKTGVSNTTEIGGPKTADSRRVVQVEAIASGTRAALRDLWVQQGQPTSGLVIIDNLARPVAPDAYTRRFVVLCSDAGVPRLRSIHALRHTIATALHEAGVPPVEAASLLGHGTLVHQQFYLPTSNEHGAHAAEKAGAIFARKIAT